jgi:hypothetical protein
VSNESEEVYRQIDKLSPPDQLRLAAGLLEKREPAVAVAIARRVITELEALLVLKKKGAM